MSSNVRLNALMFHVDLLMISRTVFQSCFQTLPRCWRRLQDKTFFFDFSLGPKGSALKPSKDFNPSRYNNWEK